MRRFYHIFECRVVSLVNCIIKNLMLSSEICRAYRFIKAILVPFFDASIAKLTAVMVEKGGKLVNGDGNEGRDECEEDSDEESMTEQIDKG